MRLKKKKKPPSTSTTSSPRGTNSNTNSTNSPSASRNYILQGLLLLSLGLVLGHTLTLLQQGHSLVEQQQQDFANQHKNNFLQQKKPYGAQWIKTSSQATKADNLNPNPNQPLANLRILVAIASFDFSQLPHLEETLDGYHDVCVAGVAHLDVYVHTTVVYPVAWLDMWATRFNCPNFRLIFSVENKNLRLHLVDLHRQLFYQELQNYDLFIYTEDDIRVTPTTVATYWQETQQLKQQLPDYTLFNVGIVRYEYNFPSVVIDDKTRHATENVTRVYWEHSIPLAQNKPILPNAAQPLDQLNLKNQQLQSSTHYIQMRNHHQGMFLATRDHLLKWKQLPNCKFHIATKRPGYGKNQRQPIVGTQRVWMSSYQLYEPKYCNIQQVLPVQRFGALTVHHVPNKNYRRKKNGKTKLTFGNATSHVGLDQGSPDLITALQLHLTLAQHYPKQPQSRPQNRGKLQLLDHVTRERTPILEERLEAWRNYVARGAILSDQDMERTHLIEWSERLEYILKMQSRRKRTQERQQQAEREEEEVY